TGGSQAQCDAAYVHSDRFGSVALFRHDSAFRTVRQDRATNPGPASPAPGEADHQSRRKDGVPQGGPLTPRTQKITSNLSGGCGFCGNRGQIDVCRMRLYVYGRCHAPTRLRKPSASIVRVTCCCMSINSPMRSSSWRRTAPYRAVKPIATSNKLSG